MRPHRRNYRRIDIEFFKDFHADLNVRAFDLLIHRFADIVQQPGPPGDFHIGADFRGDRRGKMRHFHRMQQNVLAVAGPEFQPSEQLHQPRVKVQNIDIVTCLVARLFNLVGDLFFGHLHGFFDTGGLDARILY